MIRDDPRSSMRTLRPPHRCRTSAGTWICPSRTSCARASRHTLAEAAHAAGSRSLRSAGAARTTRLGTWTRSSGRSEIVIAIVDTGPLYAVADAGDDAHAACLAVLERTDLDLVVPALVGASIPWRSRLPPPRTGRSSPRSSSGMTTSPWAGQTPQWRRSQIASAPTWSSPWTIATSAPFDRHRAPPIGCSPPDRVQRGTVSVRIVRRAAAPAGPIEWRMVRCDRPSGRVRSPVVPPPALAGPEPIRSAWRTKICRTPASWRQDGFRRSRP